MAAILVIEDEQATSEFLRRGLQLAGHSVRVSRTGEDALRRFGDSQPNLVLLDLALPGIDGVEVCRTIRATAETPIIVLSGRDSVEAKVESLDAGADDYVVKPFAFSEMLARVRAALRRGGAHHAAPVRTAALEIDPGTRTAVRGGREIVLTLREFDLLLLLAENAGRIVPRTVLIDRVWGGHDSMSDPVKVYINYVRKKLNGPGEPDLIRSVRGVGYMLQR